MQQVTITLTIESKNNDDNVRVADQEVIARLRDVLRDVTKHDDMIEWMVTAVRSA